MLSTRGRDCWLTSFDPADGVKLWDSDVYSCRYPIPPPVQIGANQLLITGGYEAGTLLVEVKGSGADTELETIFEIDRGSQIHLPIVRDGHVYMLVNENANSSRRNMENGGLACYTLKGEERWRTGADPYFGRGSMLAADGMLIVQDGLSGVLHLVETTPDAYRPLAEAEMFGAPTEDDRQMWAPLALSNGRLLMRSQDTMKCVLLAGTQ